MTPSQTIGPFFAPILDPAWQTLAGPATHGERIRIEGVVRDGDGSAVSDAMVELWQADADGAYRHTRERRAAVLDPSFNGFGRAGTDDEGRYWFETIRPGSVTYPDGRPQSPHASLTVFARGLLNHLATRLYFDDEPGRDMDPILLTVPSARRGTLIARRDQSQDRPVFRFDIVLQGDDRTETVFFAL